VSFSNERYTTHARSRLLDVDVSQPYSAVSPTLEGEVLVTLVGTTRPLTGRQVARLVRRGTQRGVLGALHRLVDQGLVNAQDAGNAVLYTLNRDHLAYPAVEILAGIRSTFTNRLRETIVSWAVQPIHVSVFGSAARGDGDTASDIDLFVVRPDDVGEEDPAWRQQLDELSASVRRWTGNQATISEVSESAVGRLKRERPPVVDELETDAILLVGTPVKDLQGERR